MTPTKDPAAWASVEQPIHCVIDCQKGRRHTAALRLGETCSGEDFTICVTEQSVKGCRIGSLQLRLKSEPHVNTHNLAAEFPIKLWMPAARPSERMTAFYLYNPWWTRPAFVERFQDIPARTQVLLLKYPDAFGCLVPMVGKRFKTWLVPGRENQLALETGCGVGGAREVNEPLYLYAEGKDLFQTIHRAFRWLAEDKGIRLREDRRVPEPFHYLGWCSWDAFYRDVSEAGIRQKADELRAKQVPVRWFMIDDGWFPVQDNALLSLHPDPDKFPHGLKELVRDLQQEYHIDWIGVWHALAGFWGGIAPRSEAFHSESGALFQTAAGTLLPSPDHGERFYRDWYDLLRREGIRFVKVDGQSSTANYFENSLPLAEAAAGLGRALEDGGAGMDGAILNCMGMAMENILARPVSALSRNSDDFFPQRPDGFAEHLLQNAYNSLYHNEIYHCDWDMFWTSHPDAQKHALLRAISGGPVYISDPVGQTHPEVLKPLTCLDGRIFRLDRSAKPTEDCVFSDPLQCGVLKLHNIAADGQGHAAGGMAVFNLTQEPQHFSFSAGDIPELDRAGTYWVYDFFAKKSAVLTGGALYQGDLAPGGYAWFVLLPQKQPAAFLGLTEKYAGFAAAEILYQTEKAVSAVFCETGPVGWLSEQPPQAVWFNGADVTAQVKVHGTQYTLDCPKSPAKALLTIQWPTK